DQGHSVGTPEREKPLGLVFSGYNYSGFAVVIPELSVTWELARSINAGPIRGFKMRHCRRVPTPATKTSRPPATNADPGFTAGGRILFRAGRPGCGGRLRACRRPGWSGS